MKILEGKTALVTGGSRGIGEAIVRRFAEQGADVAFTYLSSEDRAKKVESNLKALGSNAKAYRSDASSYAQAQELVNAVLEDYGKIDILINNAGITRDNLMLRMSEENWDEVIQTNLKSVFNLTKHVLRPMLKNRSGSIINMSSVVGIFGMLVRQIMRLRKLEYLVSQNPLLKKLVPEIFVAMQLLLDL